MRRTVCVFNRNRESFLGLRVAPADTWLMRMKGALGKLGWQPDDGIWLSPSRGIHTIGMLFPIDLIFLGKDKEVVHVEEHVRPFRISNVSLKATSVLELPPHTIYRTGTKVGDQIEISKANPAPAAGEPQPENSTAVGR